MYSKRKLFVAVSLFLSFFLGPISAIADTSSVTVTVSVFACSDGLDNDNDSFIDYPDDSGCESGSDSSEVLVTHCSDGLDNDSDGLIDFPADIGCDASSDTSEANQLIVSSGGGGGGGGGGGENISTQVTTNGQIIFKGKAYPRSTVTLLKGAEVVSRIPAGADASFSATLSNITPGQHIFAMYSEDTKGVRSSLLTFPVIVSGGSTVTVGGIVISPTLSADKTEVRRGDPITFFGQALPESSVTLQINSEEEIFVDTKADSSGSYFYQFNSALLELGSHSVKSSASKSGQVSTYGKSASFVVGTKNVSFELSLKTEYSSFDLNKDARINIIDFSILAYWYKRSGAPLYVDLNKDGKIDLIDLSILAYNWTG